MAADASTPFHSWSPGAGTTFTASAPISANPAANIKLLLAGRSLLCRTRRTALKLSPRCRRVPGACTRHTARPLNPGSVPNLFPEAQEKLATAVESGLIGSPENGYRPGFVIMTPEQLARLQNEVFAPLLEKITLQFHRLSELFQAAQA